MNLLSSLKASIALFAAQAVCAALEEGKHLGGELVADAKELGGEILSAAQAEFDKAETQVEDSFFRLTNALGSLASNIVVSLTPSTIDGVALSGNEKANLATTQLVDAASQQGIDLTATHASSIIQNAYIGVKDVITRLLTGIGA